MKSTVRQELAALFSATLPPPSTLAPATIVTGAHAWLIISIFTHRHQYTHHATCTLLSARTDLLYISIICCCTIYTLFSLTAGLGSLPAMATLAHVPTLSSTPSSTLSATVSTLWLQHPSARSDCLTSSSQRQTQSSPASLFWHQPYHPFWESGTKSHGR